jgi:hypothetical protein
MTDEEFDKQWADIKASWTPAQIVAKELKVEYERVLFHHYGDTPKGSAGKKCALACVEHILENQNTREIDYIFYTEVREWLKN